MVVGWTLNMQQTPGPRKKGALSQGQPKWWRSGPGAGPSREERSTNNDMGAREQSEMSRSAPGPT